MEELNHNNQIETYKKPKHVDPIEQKVDKIFEELNFLKLKFTASMFLELDDNVLEKFAEKYSNILIYLLNILDKDSSTKLINKLTIRSIIYLIEEEIRLLLLGEFKFEDNFEDLAKISLLIDELDFSETQNFLKKENFEEIKESIKILLKRKGKESVLKFNYLLNFDFDQIKNLISVIVQKRPIILPILMVFAPDSVKAFLLQEIIERYPEFIKVLPEDIYELKFYSLLRDKMQKILDYLPKEVVQKLEYLEIVKRLENALNNIILEFQNKNYNEKEKKEKILNQVYEMLIPEAPEIQELLLIDFLNKHYLSPQDVEILQLLFKQNK
ncbi:MAG: hypothetical protein N2247_11215 [Leptospiraceae bacterium]|jgi:hypothetical protein|nr:hypothetical protein [Leptospiraceae bacterium]